MQPKELNANFPRSSVCIRTYPILSIFLPHIIEFAGVQLPQEKSPEEGEALVRRRTTSEGQYENSPQEPSSPRSPTVRSPIHCVSPEVVSSIAANPGGRPKEVLF